MPSGNRYAIQRGDTLTAVAKSFGVTVAELVTANKIKDPNNVPVGTVLIIPPHSAGTTKPTTTTTTKANATTTTTATTSNSTYTVKAGDTLMAIAAKFKVSLSSLQTANGIKDPNTIYVGQVLKIPAH